VREADLLVHVVDISHAAFQDQLDTVNRTLAEIDSSTKKHLVVFNKIDAFSYTPKEEDDLTPRIRENDSLEDLQKMWKTKTDVTSIFISAKEKTNIDELKELFYEEVKKIHITRFPYNDFLFDYYEEEVEE
jgi:GTP-binding protein HflX